MKTKEGGVMDIQKEREAFETWLFSTEKFKFRNKNFLFMLDEYGNYEDKPVLEHWETWQAAKAQAVPAQLDVNSILHDIDCYFDNGLSNTERTANNLLQSIYEKLSGEIKAQEPAND